MSRMTPRRALAVAIAFAAVLGAGATAAQAARPHPGATYRGKIVETSGAQVLASQPISFTVDRHGQTVASFTLTSGYPVYCAPTGIGDAESATAKVSQGAFRAVLPIFAPHHLRQGSLIVTGAFALDNLESGAVTTHFTIPSLHACNGTAAYTAKALSR